MQARDHMQSTPNTPIGYLIPTDAPQKGALKGASQLASDPTPLG